MVSGCGVCNMDKNDVQVLGRLGEGGGGGGGGGRRFGLYSWLFRPVIMICVMN